MFDIGMSELLLIGIVALIVVGPKDLPALFHTLGRFTAKMRALAILSITSGLTINELSVFAVTEQSTMSRTLDALEEQGYIRRVQRVDDMRVREVHVTDAGRAAFAEVWPAMYDRFLRMFDGIDEDEYRAFTGTLHKVLRNIRRHDM